MRAEHLKLLLQDAEAQDLLDYATTRLARAQAPPEVAVCIAMARRPALRKPDEGVHGITTGMCSVACWFAFSPSNGQPLPIRQHALTSLPCNRGQPQTHRLSACGLPWTRKTMRLLSCSMAGALTTASRAPHFPTSCGRWCHHCCRSCACSTASPPNIAGGIPGACSARCRKVKGANRVSLPFANKSMPMQGGW